MESYDIMIKGGKIVDGSGNPWFKSDIAVVGEKIAKVGSIGSHEAGKVIDANGFLVCSSQLPEDFCTPLLRGQEIIYR